MDLPSYVCVKGVDELRFYAVLSAIQTKVFWHLEILF